MVIESYMILYVADQDRSTNYYSQLLNLEARLEVPGMTEFELSNGCVLGLMPEQGIKKLLGDQLPDPALARGIPRAEVYLLVKNAKAYHERALSLGAQPLSPLTKRSWGHRVAYSLDFDGHVIAFAEEMNY